jgi:hypothetical protein
LTNYVYAISNYVTSYPSRQRWVNAYTYNQSLTGPGGAASPSMPIRNGFRIIGLLSTPKYVMLPPPPRGPQPFLSNHVVAYIRSMSGPAAEKAPQDNPDVRDMAFAYRTIVEIAPYGTNYFDWNWTNFSIFPTNAPEFAQRLEYFQNVTNLQNNVRDLRLSFRWPLTLPATNQNAQIFRTMVSSDLESFVEPVYRVPGQPTPEFTLYFFKPQRYVKTP